MPTGGERHLAILQMKARIRKLIEPADMVVVKVREDHTRCGGCVHANERESFRCASQQSALASIGIFVAEAGINHLRVIVAHDRPDEIVHGHWRVMRITTDEVVGSAGVAFGILNREDVVCVWGGHRRRVPNMDESLFETGIEARSRVIGPEYVTRAFSAADAFSREFQEMVTEYCWGRVWGRDALTDRQRSLNNLCILASLNRGQEFKLHFKGALKNGCTLNELRDTLIQIMVYAGVPAGVESFRLAREVLDAEGITPPPTDKPMPHIPGA